MLLIWGQHRRPKSVLSKHIPTHPESCVRLHNSVGLSLFCLIPVNNVGDSFSKHPAPKSEPDSPEHACKVMLLGVFGVQRDPNGAG